MIADMISQCDHRKIHKLLSAFQSTFRLKQRTQRLNGWRIKMVCPLRNYLFLKVRFFVLFFRELRNSGFMFFILKMKLVTGSSNSDL